MLCPFYAKVTSVCAVDVQKIRNKIKINSKSLSLTISSSLNYWEHYAVLSNHTHMKCAYHTYVHRDTYIYIYIYISNIYSASEDVSDEMESIMIFFTEINL